MSPVESGTFRSASDMLQIITPGAAAVAVTLKNPHSILNNTANDGYVSMKLNGMSTYANVRIGAGAELVKEVVSVGPTADVTDAGKTAVTELVVFGRN